MANSARRNFLKRSAQLGVLAGVGDFAFLGNLPALSADDVRVPPDRVQYGPDIEPLVRLLEDTDRDALLERVAAKVREGTTYGDLLRAVMLAGVRGIQPRPVGFKFHAVLVINSAHLATLASQDRDRWLPLFWSIDNFKRSQAMNRTQGNWHMAALPDAALPASVEAGPRFRDAMDRWETEAADRAIASWARFAGANEIYETFWRLGARDFRDIGHKAIFVANSYRLLQTIGWRHAEPILRSLTYALTEHEGTNPAQRDADADRPWRENLRKAVNFRASWQRGRVSREATLDLLAAMRTAGPGEVSDKVVELVRNEIDPASLWDAIFLMGGECLMRQPGIVALHTLTTANALSFAFHQSSNDETRRMMLLQAASFMPMFREAMGGRGRVGQGRIDALEPADVRGAGAAAVEEIFAHVGPDRTMAARKTLAFLNEHPERVYGMMSAARRLIFTHGTDSHDYKFSSAALEDFFHVTPAWRDRFLASAMFQLRGSNGAETTLTHRIRGALETR